MMTVETIGRIRRAHLVEGESIRQMPPNTLLAENGIRYSGCSVSGIGHAEPDGENKSEDEHARK